MSGSFVHYSRWRPKPAAGGWTVVAENGERDAGSSVFDEYRGALGRSDDLNRREQHVAIGWTR